MKPLVQTLLHMVLTVKKKIYTKARGNRQLATGHPVFCAQAGGDAKGGCFPPPLCTEKAPRFKEKYMAPTLHGQFKQQFKYQT